MKQTKIKLYELLYGWFVSETCDDCRHIESFRDGDARHPCNKCECYERFKVADSVKEDLKDKVNEIMEIIKEKQHGKEI